MCESVFQIAGTKEDSKRSLKRIKTSFVVQQLPDHDLVENSHSRMKSYTQHTKGPKQKCVNSDCS